MLQKENDALVLMVMNEYSNTEENRLRLAVHDEDGIFERIVF